MICNHSISEKYVIIRDIFQFCFLESVLQIFDQQLCLCSDVDTDFQCIPETVSKTQIHKLQEYNVYKK